MEAYLTIGVGRKGCLFTLRQIDQMAEYGIHLVNLAANAEEAYSKAVQYAERFQMPLEVTLDEIKTELNKIQRATAEEINARQAEQEEKERIQAEYVAEQLEAGVYPFGRYKGVAYREADVGYINYVASLAGDDNGIWGKVGNKVKAECKDLLFPESNGQYFGNVGDKIEQTATVTRIGQYYSQFGTVRLTTLTTEDGYVFLVKSTSFGFTLRAGDTFKFKATIKEHSNYMETKQTVILRVKIIDIV